MKKLVLIIFAGLIVAASHAQSKQVQPKERKDHWAYWTISKDVQRFPYRNFSFEPSKLSTGNNTWYLSKGVQQINARKEVPPAERGTVSMQGYPTWTISKGVARFNMEKKQDK